MLGRTPDSQWGEPGSNPICCRFKDWEMSFSPRCLTSFSCMNEYLSIDSSVVDMRGCNCSVDERFPKK